MLSQKYLVVFAFIALSGVAVNARSLEAKENIACPVCEHAVQKLREHVDTTSLEDLVPAMCMFAKKKVKCVTKLVDRIENLHALTSKQICMATHMCQMEQTSEASIGCPACIHTMVFANKTLGNPDVKKDILKIIPVLCTFSGSKCVEKLTDHVNKATAVLAKSTPFDVCSEIKMCYPKDSQLKVKLDGEFACPMCKYIVKKAKTLVLQNKTDTEIISGVQRICVIFRTHKNVCLSLIQKKLAPVLSKLRNSDETQVCQEMNMCAAPNPVTWQGTTDFCTFATEEGEALQAVLKDEENIKPIFDAITKNCATFGVFANSCTSFFSGLVKNAVDAILKLDITLLLKHLHICA